MKTVLITQCLQNDFVKPLASGEPLPNQLHIGHNESQRLVGDDKNTGPIGRFMTWANSHSEKLLDVIHIRDWHNPGNADQMSHLKQFGNHCIKNTVGAEFIFKTDHGHATIIESTTLNDFEGTSLKEKLDSLVNGVSSGEKIRIGIIGVWTEAKVFFLAYEIATRYPNIELAACSALTASSSRSQHFLALQQLQRIVGTTVIDSIGEFIQFLGGEELGVLCKSLNESLEICIDDEILLSEESENLIRYLFRDCKKISLKTLDGGFSGNLVAGVNSIDIHGHNQTPHVIKIGPRNLMARERTSFEQIENVLGNNAPAIAEYADALTQGAIKYRYASMGGDATRSLQECFQNNESLDSIHKHLDEVFNEQLGRLYRASINETHNLLDYYCFDSEWSESVKTKIEELIGHCPETDKIQLPGDRSVYNLYRFYREDLDKLPSTVADYPFAFVHGDLNGANVIIDSRDNVWVIDFFHTHRGHVLKDFCKLENDILYIYTEINTEQDLVLAYEFTDFLLSLENNLAFDKVLPNKFVDTQFERAFTVLRFIRTIAKQNINDDSPEFNLQWLIPQLRYAVHTIGFDEPNELQRIWALYTAAKISEVICKCFR